MKDKPPRAHRLADKILDIAAQNQIPPDELMECAVNLLSHAIAYMGLCVHQRPKMVQFAMDGVTEGVEHITEALEQEDAQEGLEEADAEAWLGKLPPDRGNDEQKGEEV